MEFRKVLTLRGPNIWANFPVIEAWVDLGDLNDRSSDQLVGFNERLTAWRTMYYGMLWEAGRRGSLLPASLEQIKLGEDKRNMHWILLYQTKWFREDQPLLDYIREHYSIRQIGYRDNTVIYYLLYRGGAFDPAAFDTINAYLARRYQFSTGAIDLYVKER